MAAPTELVKSLLRDAMLRICHQQITFYSNLIIKAKVEVTVDNADILNLDINEILQVEKTSREKPIFTSQAGGATYTTEDAAPYVQDVNDSAATYVPNGGNTCNSDGGATFDGTTQPCTTIGSVTYTNKTTADNDNMMQRIKMETERSLLIEPWPMSGLPIPNNWPNLVSSSQTENVSSHDTGWLQNTDRTTHFSPTLDEPQPQQIQEKVKVVSNVELDLESSYQIPDQSETPQYGNIDQSETPQYGNIDQSGTPQYGNIDQSETPQYGSIDQSETQQYGNLDQSEVDFIQSDDAKDQGYEEEYNPDEAIDTEVLDVPVDVSYPENIVIDSPDEGEEGYFSQAVVEALTCTTQLQKIDGLYTCPHCDFVTEHGSAMNIHLRAHEKNVNCEQCDEMFSCVSLMRRHMFVEHHISTNRKLTTLFTCRVCKAEFNSAQDLSIHKKTEHSVSRHDKMKRRGRKPICKLCRIKFDSQEDVDAHMSEAHDTKPSVCTLCGYMARHAASLERHMKKHGQDLPEEKHTDKHKLKSDIEETEAVEESNAEDSGIICDICGENVDAIQALRKHIKTVHDLHNCSGCSFSTPRPQALDKHQCVENRAKLICGVCARSDFVCKTQHKKHVQQDHPMDHRRKQCDFCDKVFCSRQGLYTHRKVVHGEELEGAKREVFTCHVCGKSFPIFKYLKGHMKSHEDAEPYKCPKCQKTFKYHRNFKSHKQGCINTQGYPCQFCKKTLKNEYGLRVHIKGVHLNEKNDAYPCRKCNMPFSHLPTRATHEKKCSGSRSQVH